ncbi:30S ribosomal protein S1 [compost metagenome]
MADKFVANAADVVKVHQKVEVTVVEVDVARKRISLSMKKEMGAKSKNDQHKQADKAKKFAKSGNGSPSHKKPLKPQHNHKGGQKEKPLPDGDLQMKLEALKNMFK